MKKFSLLLALIMILSCVFTGFVACAKDEDEGDNDDDGGDKTSTEKTYMVCLGDSITYGQDGEYGIGILSKHPIMDEDCYKLDSQGREQRMLAYAKIKINGKMVNFFTSHLSFEADNIRKSQLAEIEDYVSMYTNAFLTADFNLRSIEELAVLSEMSPVSTVEDPIISYRGTDWNTQSIDNICYTTDDFEVVDAYAVDNHHSDHFLLVAEFVGKRITKPKEINAKTALIMGLGQAVAIFPGISRSGSTITAGLTLAKGERNRIADFSFIMSIPIILGSTIIEAATADYSTINIPATSLGVIAAFITGFLAIKFMLKIISKCNFKWFSLYLFLLFLLTFINGFVHPLW